MLLQFFVAFGGGDAIVVFLLHFRRLQFTIRLKELAGGVECRRNHTERGNNRFGDILPTVLHFALGFLVELLNGFNQLGKSEVLVRVEFLDVEFYLRFYRKFVFLLVKILFELLNRLFAEPLCPCLFYECFF